MIKSKFVLRNYVVPTLLVIGKKGGNASYFYRDGKQYLLTRETDYIYSRMPNGAIKMCLENDTSSIIHSDEALYLKVDDKFVFQKYLTKTGYGENVDYGFEDSRTIVWDGCQYVMFNRRNLKQFSNVQMHIGVIDSSLAYVKDKVLYSPVKVEKNWQPIESMPGVCVYAYNPFRLINVFNGKYIDVANQVGTKLCGSSQIVDYGENRLGICHVRNADFEYLHYFVLFNRDMKVLKVSEPFSFFGANVEFNTYLEYRDGSFIILMSVHDQLIYEFKVSEEVMNRILNGECDKKGPCKYEAFYMASLKNNNVFAALGFSTFCKDKRILKDAITRNHARNYFRKNFQLSLQTYLIGRFNAK